MRRNISILHRSLRILIGLAVAIMGLLMLGSPESICVAIAGGLLVLSGLAGYCPVCHVARRG